MDPVIRVDCSQLCRLRVMYFSYRLGTVSLGVVFPSRISCQKSIETFHYSSSVAIMVVGVRIKMDNHCSGVRNCESITTGWYVRSTTSPLLSIPFRPDGILTWPCWPHRERSLGKDLGQGLRCPGHRCKGGWVCSGNFNLNFSEQSCNVISHFRDQSLKLTIFYWCVIFSMISRYCRMYKTSLRYRLSAFFHLADFKLLYMVIFYVFSILRVLLAEM